MKFVWAEECRQVKNHTLAFKLKMNVQGGELLRIAAGNLYRLFAGGRLLGYGPARAAHGYCRVDEYTLEEYAGQELCLVAEVYGSNVNSYYYADELPFFGCEIMRHGLPLYSSEDFICCRLTDRLTNVQRFSFQRTFVESYRMERCRQNFYTDGISNFPRLETQEVNGAILLQRGVSYTQLNSLCFKQIVEKGELCVNKDRPVWQDRSLSGIGEEFLGYKYEELEDRLSDQVSRFEYRAVPGKGELSLESDRYIILDLGRTVTGFNHICLEAEADSVVYVTFDEVVSCQEGYTEVDPFRNGCCNVQKFHLKAGTYDLLAFEANSLRYAQITVTAGKVKLHRFDVVLYENPDTEAFAFHTGDKELDRITEAARNTFIQNSVDLLTDCPSRERAGWLCDSYFSARAERFFTGGNKVERNFLENYILSPHSPYLPEGMLPMCYPADFKDHNFIPNWAMWFVLEIESYCRRTGAYEMVELAREKTCALLEYLKGYENEDGLLEDLDGWVFVEWSRCNDYTKGVNYPTNMLYTGMLTAAARLYTDEKLMIKSIKLREKITSDSYNGEFFEDNRVRINGRLKQTGNITETCQYYAFYFDIADKEEFPVLYDTLMNQFGPHRDSSLVYPDVSPSNAFMGNYLRLELRLRNGEYASVIADCREYFLKMADLTGTLWEHDHTGASLDHGFASIAASYIAEAWEGLRMSTHETVRRPVK